MKMINKIPYLKWIKTNFISILMNGPLVVYFVYILTTIPLGVQAQRSLVDLRDSTSTKSKVIIIRCDCSCDTIPKIDSLPI